MQIQEVHLQIQPVQVYLQVQAEALLVVCINRELYQETQVEISLKLAIHSSGRRIYRIIMVIPEAVLIIRKIHHQSLVGTINKKNQTVFSYRLYEV